MNHVTAERSIKKRWSCPFEYIMRSNDNRTKMFFLFAYFAIFFIAYICFFVGLAIYGWNFGTGNAMTES